MEKHLLRPATSYEKEQISLHLGTTVKAIDRKEKALLLEEGRTQAYDKLVLATGARPLVPAIRGLETASNLFVLRTAQDAMAIRQAFQANPTKRVVVIGGGYIGLETAASLRKLGADVTVLEREDRVLARVTAPELSAFFEQLHAAHGVNVFTGKNVQTIESGQEAQSDIVCKDGSRYSADLIVVGVGIRVNTELAEAAGLEIENGIRVDQTARTSDPDIYAIGDCTYHYNPQYDRFVRLESVPNALEQAKVAAAAIGGKNPVYDSLPWFWSDQFDVKLQLVGLSEGYTEALVRTETGKEHRFSVWYFRNDTLLAVDAVNFPKAYVMGMRLIKSGQKINQANLRDPSVEFSPANLLVE